MTKVKGIWGGAVILVLTALVVSSCSGGGGGGSSGGFDSGDDSGNNNPGNDNSGDDGINASLSKCATADLDGGNLAYVATLFQQFKDTSQLSRLGKATRTYATIPVIFHIISKGPSVEEGELPDSMIAAQVDVLNRAFSGQSGGIATPFRFELAGIDRVRNEAWFNMDPGTEAEINAKQALHKGDAKTLNFYTVNSSGGILGFSTFPVLYPILADFDGVVVHYQTLPGGVFNRYDTGLVGVHEVGHWMGLLHTFQNECDKVVGDLVDDTPQEKLPGKGEYCPIGRDSCTDMPGEDPIHNHLTYTVDECRFEFTKGQVQLMEFNATFFRSLATN